MIVPARYAKFITALAGQALLFSQVEWGGSNRWVQAATALAVALGVLAVPNKPPARLRRASRRPHPGPALLQVLPREHAEVKEGRR